MCSTFAWVLTKPDLVVEQLGLLREGGGVEDAHGGGGGQWLRACCRGGRSHVGPQLYQFCPGVTDSASVSPHGKWVR